MDKIDEIIQTIKVQERGDTCPRYTNGGLMHGDMNWESGDKHYRELCKQSAFRHFIQRMSGETDEDHAMACVWNIFAYEHLLAKQDEGQKKKSET